MAFAAAIALALTLAVPATSAARDTGQARRHPRPQRCPGAEAPATATPAPQLRAAVSCLINQQRILRRLPAVHASPLLDRSAQAWSDMMVATDNFSHGPGNAFADRISATGYDWQTAGENIATGYPTPRSAVAAWMASEDHCRNILSPSFRDVGTGVNPHPVSGAARGPATWTEDFGLLQSQSPPSGDLRPMDGCPYR
jgi:uncharacterized protein YkwD